MTEQKIKDVVTNHLKTIRSWASLQLAEQEIDPQYVVNKLRSFDQKINTKLSGLANVVDKPTTEGESELLQ